jgi:hypothetical protein
MRIDKANRVPGKKKGEGSCGFAAKSLVFFVVALNGLGSMMRHRFTIILLLCGLVVGGCERSFARKRSRLRP